MKKRLFISSILMTLVLLVAITTATFAWYQAGSAGSRTSYGAQTGKITAASDNYEVGTGVELSVWFGGTDFTAGTYVAVEGENAKAAEGVTYFERHEYATGLYVYTVKSGLTVGESSVVGLYTASTAPSFANKKLSNEDGKAYAYTTGGLVEQTPGLAAMKGEAKVFAAISTEDPATLSQYAGNYTITIHGAGQIKLHASAPSIAEDGFLGIREGEVSGENDIVIVLNISTSGVVTVVSDDTDIAGLTWANLKDTTKGGAFYYSVRNQSEGKEETSNHGSDAITLSIANS